MCIIFCIVLTFYYNIHCFYLQNKKVLFSHVMKIYIFLMAKLESEFSISMKNNPYSHRIYKLLPFREL